MEFLGVFTTKFAALQERPSYYDYPIRILTRHIGSMRSAGCGCDGGALLNGGCGCCILPSEQGIEPDTSRVAGARVMNLIKRYVLHPLGITLKDYRSRSLKKILFADLAPLVPPLRAMFDGAKDYGAFKSNGEEFFKIFREVCDLRSDERMLDVGCGIGRKTLPLTRYFDARATYVGIDITKEGIDWCRAMITPRFPHFQFRHVDVYNTHYNPRGTIPAAKFRFPFDDRSFSFVMLGSVFTHMLPDAVENYLSEIARVLEAGGRCLITYFLLNDHSLRSMEIGRSALDFKHRFDRFRAVSRQNPEKAVALEEEWVTGLYGKAGLHIVRADYGSWRERGKAFTFQDMILAAKK